MMRGIVSTSIEYRFLVIVVVGAMLVLGIGQLGSMPVDVLPEFSPPYVEIQTEALGLSTEEVEGLITVPLEQDLLNGVAWLDVIRSESVPGLSSITLIFEPGTDLYRARQMVAERLAQAPLGLPNVSKSPTMLQPMSATSRVIIVGLSSKTLPLIPMSVLARWTIGPRLMAVPGVANVAIWGLRDRQLQVLTDPERLRAYDVSLAQVVETTGNALWVSTLSYLEASLPGNAGFIDTPQQRIGVRHILPIVSPEGLGQVPIEGAQVRLMDVADVVENHQPLIGDALTNNGTGLFLVIEKFPGSNTLEVTQGVEEALAVLQPGLGGIEIDSTIFRPATFIEIAMDNLARALIIGCVLLVLVLGAFFFDWRTALISFIAIPLSVLAAGLVLHLRNATLNVMVLAGLVIAIGVIVDEAIIDVENIVRRLYQRRREGSDQSAASIILEASLEVRGAVFFATLICLLAVLPVFSLQGLPGAFFQPLAVSYVLAVLASLFVALTVTPMLCAVLLSNAPVERRTSPLTEWLRRGYDAVLARIVSRPRGAYLTVGIIAVAGLAALPFLRPSLLPTFKEPDLLIRLEAAPGTSLPAMVRQVDEVSRELRSIPGVRNVGVHVGRAIYGDQVVGINSAELWISVAPAADYGETVAAVNQTVDNYPGLQCDVQTYLNQTSGKVMPGPGDSIVVRIYGQDWAVLGAKAEEVRQALAGTAGVVDSKVKLPVEEPILEVEVDLAAAQRYGIKPGDVRRASAILLNGLPVGNLFEEQKVFDVVVWSTAETRQNVTSIRELLIDTPAGGRVRLGDVAQVRIVPAPTVIKHENVSRYLDVGLNVRGRDFGSVVGDVKRRLEKVQFPLEYHAEVLSEYAQQQAAQNRFLGFAGVALIGIFLLLQASCQSWRLALLSFLTLPLALVGGLLAALAGGGTLGVSLGALVGFLTVFGIAARNQMMLIHHYQHLERYEGEAFGPKLVLRGAHERFAPILMTAFATGLVLVPCLLLGDIPGLELLRPMAMVILGGLITSTLLNLFIVPTIYLRLAVTGVHDLELVPVTRVAQVGMQGGMSQTPGMGAGK